MRIRLKHKKVKNEIISMRESLDKKLNYNIFVGDNRYKTDALLRFKEPQAYIKYSKFSRRRNRRFINVSSVIQQIMIFYYWLSLESILFKYLVLLGMLAIMIMQYGMKYQINRYKEHLLLVQTTILTFLIPENDNEDNSDDPRVYLGPMFLMLCFGRSWIEFSLYSIGVNLLRSLGKGFPIYFLTYTQLPYLWTAVWLFGFAERSFKENWVLVDSHK